MRSNLVNRHELAETPVIKRKIRMCCYALLWLCAIQLTAFAQAGSTSTHLNDAGAQVGRSAQPVEAPPAAFTGTERPDTASFRMSIPLVDLPGRGLGINLGLHYDSSLYQLTWNGQNSLVDFTGIYPQAPSLGFQLGFGTLVKHNDVLACDNIQLGQCNPPGAEFCPFWNGGIGVERPITFIDQSGARHRVNKGITVDGSDLRYRDESGTPTITFPDGTKVFFGNSKVVTFGFFVAGQFPICGGFAACETRCRLDDRVFFPTKIVDRNGNFIQITYLSGGGPRINTITDTLGRVITFRYDNTGATGRVQSIVVPGFANGTEREIARFYYTPMVRQHDFADQVDTTQNITVLTRVVLPGIKAGWFFKYSSYGQIYYIEKLGGVEVDPVTGAITNPGTQLALTEYNYNGTPLNPTVNLLFQLPKFTFRRDNWTGNPGAEVAHTFNVNYIDATNKSVTTITGPDGTVSEIEKRWYHAIKHHNIDWTQTWDEGLILSAKITRPVPQKTFSIVSNTWVRTDGGPRLTSQSTTNDANQVKRVDYTYFDPTSTTVNGVTTYNGVFSNIKDIKEFGFANEQLKKTEYTYETGTNWTTRWLLKLQKSVKTFEGTSATVASQMDYAYDETPLATYQNLPNTYETTTPAERGNLTSTTVNTNAANPAQGESIVTKTKYDVFGNAVENTDGVGNATTANPNDHITKTEFSESFKFAYQTRTLTAVPDEAGAKGSATALETLTDYNFNTGLVVSTQDENGKITSNTYTDANDPPNALNRLRKVVYPDGGEMSQEYSDAPGDTWVRTRSLRQASPLKELDKYEYFDALGRLTRTYSYDGTQTTPWIASETVYDVYGRIVKTSTEKRVQNRGDALNATEWTITTFDELSRPLTVTTPDNAVVRTAYLGSKTMITDQAGKSRRREIDALGRLTKIVEFVTAVADPALVQEPVTGDFVTTYEYDILSNLKRVQQGEIVGTGCAPCQERLFSYDSLSRRTSVNNPERGVETFEYDQNGNVTKRIDARNLRTIIEYDGLDRPIKRTYDVVGGGSLPNGATATPNVDLYYDGKGIPQSITVPAASAGPLGQLTAVKSSASESIYHGFDAMGRVIASAQITSSQTYLMSYEYDLIGNMKAQTYPSGRTITHEFDDGGRLNTLKGTQTGTTTNYAQFITYSAAGKISSFKYGNGLWEHVKYNNRSQATEIGLSSSSDESGNKLKLEFKYGVLVGGTPDATKNSGNLQSQIISLAAAGTEPALTLTQTYEYDALNRLKVARENNGSSWSQTFDIDRFGNREVNGPGTTDTIEITSLSITPVKNQITKAGYGYDNTGNLLTEPGHSYKYDAENRMSSHNNFDAYTYDGDGRRIRKSSPNSATVFVYDAVGKLVAEYADVTPGSAGVNYVTPDHLNNTRVVSNSIGTVISRHDYLPFGEEINPALVSSGRQNVATYNAGTIKQKYASKERDIETGLDYFGTRYYSSVTGRFTSPDAPLVDQIPENPQSWNLYSYTRNNPVRAADQNGEVTFWDVLDVVSLVMSIYEFVEDPTLENAAWLAADVVGAVLPIIPFGSIRRGAQAAEFASDLFSVARVVERADDIGDVARWGSRGASYIDDAASTALHAKRELPILNAHFTPDATKVLQNMTNTANDMLKADPTIAKTVLSQAEYAAGQAKSSVAKMNWGKAVERLVANQIEKSKELHQQILKHVGGPKKPDFIGKGPALGKNFDITTPAAVTKHLRRPLYGNGLNVVTYIRPPTFVVFP